MSVLAQTLLQGAAELLAPFALEAGGAPIDAPGGNSAPCVVDWDGDGRFDLLVGEYEDGAVRFYRNVGAPGAPRFEAGVRLRHAEGELSVPYG
jgi:hypothetical protein